MPANTVLIVEDDPLLRSGAAAMLDEAGLSVVELESADDALAYVFEQSENVAALFTDVDTLGGMSGLELAEIVATEWSHVAVLVTSGHDITGRNLPHGVRFFPKPWRPLDVLTAMQDAAEHRA